MHFTLNNYSYATLATTFLTINLIDTFSRFRLFDPYLGYLIQREAIYATTSLSEYLTNIKSYDSDSET